ncbi:AsmA-like C-terminal region-containing protein [Neotamlana laminarinivorans]|uniref:AsmA-like C-terminal region-containing protein n=1 Tax=Neotamlana laminarinivorans TaxID=2883124 RepID=A0A9X1I287_9FLAO|nr:AsmA-like C-terminal region-containing protein [Tamlana laminarinivorans]MCB4798887.1 AsmA-like C-terminal region-containing protein [Tamlana laminarinivorans]
MKFIFLKNRKFWWRFIALGISLPIIFLTTVILFIHFKQNDIIQNEIAALNEQHKGLITIGDTHLSLFKTFPYISFKLDNVKVYETKEPNAQLILDVADIYTGFNIINIIKGDYHIKSLIIEDGFFNIILHDDRSLNIQNALTPLEETDNENEELSNLQLKNIKLLNLDIHKLDETTHTDLETFIHQAEGGFKIDNHLISSHVDTDFEMNLINNGDTTYIRHKHFELHTDISLNKNTGVLNIKPSGIKMEHGDFELEGTVDTKNDVNLDLAIKGTKPNFDLLFAFAPEDLIPILERYKNAGNIYFNGIIKGSTLNQQTPFIDINFGASDAFLENTDKRKRVNNMGFSGHFTNGEEHNLRTSKFSLTNMTASLEKGKFLGNIVITNFEEPDVNMQLNADFNLEFMAKFLNLKDIENPSGKVALEMNFHDIIDIDHPELALNRLSQAYFSELKITDLSLSSKTLPAPLKKLNAHLVLNGKKATLNQFDMLMGKSDVSITGYLSDFPSIIHHTDTPVVAHLEIESNLLDISEITKYSKTDSTGIDERIEKLSTGFSFKSSAKSFTEAKYLPKGEFFVDSLHANLKHYPHELHDFHVDFLIDDKDLKIVDFKGFIDDSDFHLNGFVHNYEFWMQEELNGDVDLDITLTSGLLKLEDIFSYKGENYVPKDYRHEEFKTLALHVNSSMHYKASALHSVDINLDKLTTKMHLHPLKFEDFSGRFHYEDDHLIIKDFIGKIGRTSFNANLNYYLGKNEAIKKRDNYIDFKANYIDFDQLFPSEATTTKPSSAIAQKDTTDIKKHAEAFNLYELPFTDMKINFDVDYFMYHRIILEKINANLRTTKNHYIYIDTLTMNAAGGKFNMSGYFNGNNPKHIYMKPNIVAENVDIDKFLFKFENFGQDHLVSDNLKGKVSTKINGNIRVYPDLVPDLDQSEIHMDVKVLNGKLQNYNPMSMLSDYMGDKNLNKVKFDTLKNHIDITNGRITIPKMTIESTLGHMELSGTQDSDYNIEYYLRIPLKTVKQAARYKLFGKKNDSINTTVDDEIIELDPNEKVRYLNIKLHGNINDYNITLGKDKTNKSK